MVRLAEVASAGSALFILCGSWIGNQRKAAEFQKSETLMRYLLCRSQRTA